MDFISLASAASSRTFIRRLAGDSYDDFSHQSSIQSDPATFDLHRSSTTTSSNVAATEYMTDQTEQKPLLSPNAEAELFMLATNFLLYVAMVIITIMVCKIYFPESLERGRTMARSVSYVRVSDEEPITSSSYYSSDAEDEAGEESGSSDDDEGSEDNEDENKGSQEKNDGFLLEMELDVAGQVGKKKDRRLRRKRRDADDEGIRLRSSSIGSILEFDQRTMSKTSVVKRLVFCVIMLNLTFVTWGVLQERMLTRRYPRLTGEYFTYSYALVFTNRCWTVVMSGGLMMYLKPRWSCSTVIYEYSFPSISNMLSSWCQYEALRYVSFPAVTLFKSFKLAPVMAMGKILGNKEYPQYDYIVALIIGVGLTMFMSSTDDLNFGYDIYGEEASATWTGIMLLFFFLFFDSFTSQWQSRMFQRHRDLSMIELMFATSAFSTVLSFITLVHSKELWPALSFVYRHSEIHLHFFMFSICSTIGQLFIFYTIKNFGAVVFTIIMTTRILLSIALSCILYGHEVTSVGFLGLMVVMGAVCYRIKRKAEGNQLIKWQGMGDDKGPELVQEWHEHVDM